METTMKRTEARIQASSDAITDAAYVMIGMVRGAEKSEAARSTSATLSLEVHLTGGGVETWEITVERVASTH